MFTDGWWCYRTYYTGTGEGTADLDCEEGDDEVNKNWRIGSDEDYDSRKKSCEEQDVPVEVTAMDAIA